MKRKTMALLLALSMCLSLLSACGSGDTSRDDKPSKSESAVSSTEQQPEESEKPEESGEPTQKPTEEPAGPTAAFLALLQDEYDNGGTLWGHSANHTCVKLSEISVFADGEDIFIDSGNFITYVWYRYNTVTKELSETLAMESPCMYIDGLFYCYDNNDKKMFTCDKTGALVYSEELGENWDRLNFDYCAPFEEGFVVCGYIRNQRDSVYTVFSYDLKEQHQTLMPEKEVAHGIKEPVTSFDKLFSVGGDAYAIADNHDGSDTSTVFKLNTSTWEWEKFDTVDHDGHYRMVGTNGVYQAFYGKYVYSSEGIFDKLTGEQVFTFDDQYPKPLVSSWLHYATDHGVYTINSNRQLVDLHSSGVSEKWTAPQKYSDMVILDGTYLVYWDGYGYFLWNALDGTEETIMLK